MTHIEESKRLPIVAIAMPSLQQGKFLGAALHSLFRQEGIDLKVAVMDAGSSDESQTVIANYDNKITFWRSYPDNGQAAAINEGINCLGEADYVGWLNVDDLILPDGLRKMVRFLEENQECCAVFGKAEIIDESAKKTGEYPTQSFDAKTFARSCSICQPASLIRKRAWEQVGGVDESLHMCMDYDLWWKLSKMGRMGYLQEFVACSRDHGATKTRTNIGQHLKEGIHLVRKYYGRVPINWYINCAAYDKNPQIKGYTFLDKVKFRIIAIRCYLTDVFQTRNDEGGDGKEAKN